MTAASISRKLKSPSVHLPLLILLVLTIGGLWFFHNFEKQPYTVNRGISPAAQNNPLLAAEKYLLASGINASAIKGMDFFLNPVAPQDTIIIRYMPGGLSQSIIDRLFLFAEAGGHIIMVPNLAKSDYPGTETIAERLGVQLMENDDKSTCGSPEKTSENEVVDNDASTHFNRISHINVSGIPTRLRFFEPIFLVDQQESAAYRISGSHIIEYQDESSQNRGDNSEKFEVDGAWLLQYIVGVGKITVLSEMTLFFNDTIGDYDHAFFLSWLIGETAKVWLVYDSSPQPLLTILWRKMPYFWLSLCMLVLLVVWKMQSRSGKLLRPEIGSKHNILTHIEASGMYGWRTDMLSAIVADNRQTLHRQLTRLNPGFHKDQEHKKNNIPFPATKTSACKEEFNQAFVKTIAGENDLIQTSRALQKIVPLRQGGESSINDS